METTTNNQNRIKKEVTKEPLTVSRVYASNFQKEGTLTAELRQTIKTVSLYPTKSISNSLNANIFEAKDFGFAETPFENTENRVAWIDVPPDSTPTSVLNRLKEFPEAGLYRILSNHPILSDTDMYAIGAEELDVTKDSIANKQAVRLPEGDPRAGQLALDLNGKIQYRRIAFSTVEMADQDSRTSNPADFYASPELTAEINEVVHIMPEQSI